MEGDKEAILGKVVRCFVSCTDKERDIRDFTNSWQDLVRVLGAFQMHVRQFSQSSDL